MARLGSDMVNELLNPGDPSKGELYANELDAIEGWSFAYAKYFEGAISNGIPVTTASIWAGGGAYDLMKAAMTGLSITGPAAIQSGITAFWGALVSAPATYFAAATVITPPPGLSGIAADILLAAPINVALKNDAPTALGGLVNGGVGGNVGIHTLTLTGATATFPGPVVSPIL